MSEFSEYMLGTGFSFSASEGESSAVAIEGVIKENEQLRRDLDIALGMLAAWCVAIDVNGTGWDDWDEHYKDAAYRAGPLRERLDAAIAKERASGCWNAS